MADDCAAADLFPPRDVEPELVEAGRLLFAREARFVAGAADPGALPPDGMPEVAFAGRSNVGKSSLVNALTGRRMLARTSNTPGRTRQLNFFDLAGELMLVDLPGYGYAEASKAAVARWTGLVRRYLRSRAALRRVCVLVDARHGVKEPDRPVLQMLDEAGISYQVVLTKVDKLRAAELSGAAERVAAELAAHTAAHPEIHLTSAEKRRGIAALRATLAGVTPRVGALAMAMPGQPR
ncbi:MAG TPA: ribosome biogenesis GTP-binding protein YihA/YsxC [Stellaceae bacterium]|jgi:GTP-binding protein|nr:ribosome biogenesis GTP-binding protein YihA/YsxC [Stellaceae bacterium]